MNILCLVDAFYPEYTGGISKSLFSEVVGLCENKHFVTVVCRRLKKETPRYEKNNNRYEIYRYNASLKTSLLYKLYPLFACIHLPLLLKKIFSKQSFDVAYVHNPFQLSIIKFFFPFIPCLYVYHASAYGEINLDIVKGKYGKKTQIFQFFNSLIKKWEYSALKKADKILVRSQFMRSDLKKLYPQIEDLKIDLIPLCTDVNHFQFVSNPNTIRKIIGLPEGKFIIFTVRRLVARMGLENLIEAISSVVKVNPDVVLILGGIGYLEKELKEMAKKLNLDSNLRFEGFIPEGKLALYYQSANLFVLPTLAYEGFGLVTIESLATGTPVVATPVGANPEILKLLGSNYLFTDNNPNAIADGINDWIKRGISIEERAKCRDYCISKFSKNKIVHEIEKVLYNVSNLKK